MELVVVMGAGAILLTLCIGLIHALLKLDRAERVHLAEGSSLGRLARAFRHDVWSATAAEVRPGDDDTPERLVLSLPEDRAVSYRVDGLDLVRLGHEHDEVDREERFRLPAGSTTRLAVDGPMVVLTIGQDRITRRVEARLARDHRFAPEPRP